MPLQCDDIAGGARLGFIAIRRGAITMVRACVSNLPIATCAASVRQLRALACFACLDMKFWGRVVTSARPRPCTCPSPHAQQTEVIGVVYQGLQRIVRPGVRLRGAAEVLRAFL